MTGAAAMLRAMTPATTMRFVMFIVRLVAENHFHIDGNLVLQNGIELYFIKPGKPTDNGFIESFNGTFRDECLSTNWFWSLHEAQMIILKWQREYNEERPHGSLGGLTPRGFALKLGMEFTIQVG